MSKVTKSPKSSVSHDASLTKAKGGKHELDASDIKLKTEEVPVVVTKRVNALKNVQLKLVEIEAKFYEDLHELECRYAKLYEPFYEKRKTIITGEYEPTEEEGKWFLDEENEQNESKTDAKAITQGNGVEPIDESKLHPSGKELLNNLKAQFNGKQNGNDEKGIFNFWLETLQSFRITSELIQEHDEPILSFLQDIKVVLFDQKPYGYRLEFHFAENPYFTNKVLTKSYELKTEIDAKDPFSYEGPDIDKSTGCKIDWKPGQNVTVKVTKKKIKSKNKKAPPKVVTKEEKQESFFSFFDTPKPSKSDEPDAKAVVLKPKRKSVGDEDDEFEDDEENAHEDLLMMADFEIGQYIREKIVPKAVLYYTGEYDDLDDEYEDYDDEDEDDEEEDEDEEDEDEDDDDDDDDDEDEKKVTAGKGGKKGGKQALGGKPGAKGAKGGEPTPSECKQN
jgi:nucleosome assembly protein 1-like 1